MLGHPWGKVISVGLSSSILTDSHPQRLKYPAKHSLGGSKIPVYGPNLPTYDVVLDLAG